MIIAVVLHLGSIEATGTSVKHMDASKIDNPAVVRNVAQLLSVDATGLAEGLTSRSALTRGEMIISRSAPLRPAMCVMRWSRVCTAATPSASWR